MYKMAATGASHSPFVRSASQWITDHGPSAIVSSVLGNLDVSFEEVPHQICATYDTLPPDIAGVLIPPTETVFSSGVAITVKVFSCLEGMKLPLSVRQFERGLLIPGLEIISGGPAMHNGQHWSFYDNGGHAHQCFGFFSDGKTVWAIFKYGDGYSRAALDKVSRQ